jgi:hypothetical protein
MRDLAESISQANNLLTEADMVLADVQKQLDEVSELSPQINELLARRKKLDEDHVRQKVVLLTILVIPAIEAGVMSNHPRLDSTADYVRKFNVWSEKGELYIHLYRESSHTGKICGTRSPQLLEEFARTAKLEDFFVVCNRLCELTKGHLQSGQDVARKSRELEKLSARIKELTRL